MYFGRHIRMSRWNASVIAVIGVCASQTHAQVPSTCKAPAELENAIQNRPSANVYDTLGAYFGQKQQLSCAVDAFRKAIRLDPNSWEARFNLGLAYIQSQQPAKALRELTVAISIRPDDPLGHTAMGVALNDLNRHDEAIEEFKLVLKADAKSVAALDGIAKALIAQHRYSAAIAYLKDAADDPGLQADLAVAYSKQGDDAMAVQILLELAKENPSSAQHHNDLATAYIQLSQYRQAVDEFHEALRLDPDDQTIRLSYVKALVILGEYEIVLPEIQTYRHHKPHEFEGMYLMGNVYRGLGKYAEAETVLRQAVSVNPNHYDARYNLGFVLAKLGKPQEALVQLEKAVDLNPASSEARFQLAGVLRALGQEERARRELATFQQSKRRSVEENVAGTKVNQANEFFQSGQYQRAADLYRESLAQDPDNARTWYDLALALDHLGKTVEERESLENAIRLDASVARAHNQLGLLDLQAGKLSNAEQELKTAAVLDPGYAEAQGNLGLLYGQQGRNNDAERLFRQATENDPQYVQAFINLALIQASESRFPEAEQSLRSALKIQENNPQALTVLAMVLTRTKRVDDGIRLFRKVIDLDPKSSESHLNLGIALADQFDLEGALSEFSKAVRLDPNSAPAHYNKGRVLLDLRRDQDAKPELEAAVRLDPQTAKPWYLLGLIQKGAGNPSEAVELLQKAAALEPKNTDILFVLGQELLHAADPVAATAEWRKVIGIDPNHSQALYNLARTLIKTDPEEAKHLEARFEDLQAQNQIMDRAQTLGNFGLSSAAAHDWPEAISQLKEGIEVCGTCSALGQLRKDLGLIYLHSGDMKNGLAELIEAKKLTPDDPDIDKAIGIAQAAQR